MRILVVMDLRLKAKSKTENISNINLDLID